MTQALLLMAGGVVLPTLREAAGRDDELTVLEDVYLDADEELHRVLTTKVFVRHGDVISSTP